MELIKKENEALAIPSYDLGGVLPDINDLEVVPMDLSIDYWTPESPGESKRLFFKEIREEEWINKETGTPELVDVAYFVEQTPDGYNQVINRSVKILSVVKKLDPGTPLQITYTGKKRIEKGSMDTWHIQPLIDRNKHLGSNKPQDDDDDPFS